MVYRSSSGFVCTAEKLLELFVALEGDDIFKRKSSLIKLIKLVYREMVEVDFPLFVLTILFNSKFQTFWQFIEFGKANGITKENWIRAIEGRTE